MMGTTVGAGAADEPTAAATGNARAVVDPQLLMAARCGHRNRLKGLLQPLEESAAAAMPEVAVVVEDHDGPPRPAAAPAAASSLLFGETATGGDSLLHVVAASGDGDGFLACATIICGNKDGRRLLFASNKNGDTPLHCAAAAGNAAMMVCLLRLADKDEQVALVRVQNKCRETALHHAVRRACCCTMHNRPYLERMACVDKLMAVDPQLACIPCDGEEEDASASASPLYLAISLGEMEIARHLFTKTKGRLSYSGPHGRNVLHAAISCANVQALGMVLKWLEEAPKMPTQAGDLLKRLTTQGDKKNGGTTPLHLAVSLWGLPSTAWIPKWPWKKAAVAGRYLAIRQLLDANLSTAYQADEQGLYPIHVSAGAGNILAFVMILQWCPGCSSLRDGKGRTLLHVAVDNGKHTVVEYLCQKPNMSWMLNAQDDNGDTALHRAVCAENFRVFDHLFRNPHVQNKEGMRPVDVAWTRMPLEAYYAWDQRMIIRISLIKVEAPYGESSRGDLFKEKHAAQQQLFAGGEDKISETITSAAQVMGILSVLVTTVTFASAFTLPGGYRADGDAAGTPVLAGSYAFEAFVLADVLAFICSLLATALLLFAGVPAGRVADRFRLVNIAYNFMMNSGRSLVAAFGLGLYVTLRPVARAIAVAIAVWMGIFACGVFAGETEDFDFILNKSIIARRRKPSAPRIVLGQIGLFLKYFWSYILIFGIPAIHKWAKQAK